MGLRRKGEVASITPAAVRLCLQNLGSHPHWPADVGEADITPPFQFSVCLRWHNYHSSDFPTLKFEAAPPGAKHDLSAVARSSASIDSAISEGLLECPQADCTAQTMILKTVSQQS